MARAVPEKSSSTWGRVVVIMPTYDEIDSLARVVGNLLDAVPGVDLLVVDDSSPDGTGALADCIATASPRARVLHRANREGLGLAYLAGFTWTRDAG